MRALALLGWFLSAALVTTVLRHWLLRFARRVPGYMPDLIEAVIVGGGEPAIGLVHHLRLAPDARYQVIGFFDDLPVPGSLHGELPFLGGTSHLARYLDETRVREVFVALPWSGSRITAVLEQLRFLPVTVRLLPEHLPPALPSVGRHSLAGVIMPTLMVPPFTAMDRLEKRSFDLVAASGLLLFLLPLFAVIAVLIKLDSRGPVLFMQTRTGQFGRNFRICKFRSLRLSHADVAAETLVGSGDARVTRVGKFLRRHSLDELPQMLNVIKGDMSLVGPRPHAARAKADGRIYTEAVPDYLLRYRAKPGMTGLAQVNGWRGDTDTLEKLHRRVECDFQYIQTWSMGLDLYILLRTVPLVFVPSNG